MLRKITRIFLLLFMVTPITVLAASIEDLQAFYVHPGFAKFIQVTSEMNQDFNKPYFAELLTIFSATALEKHPDYAKNIAKDFSTYPEQEKQLLFSALQAANAQAEIKYISKTYRYTLKDKPKYTMQSIKKLKINNDPDNLDRLWAAYFATGDAQYITNMLTYVNQDDFLLVTAQQMININTACASEKNEETCRAERANLVDSIKNKYPTKTKEILHNIVVISAALWSLEANRHQDPILDQKMKTIFVKNPKLNYQKKISQS